MSLFCWVDTSIVLSVQDYRQKAICSIGRKAMSKGQYHHSTRDRHKQTNRERERKVLVLLCVHHTPAAPHQSEAAPTTDINCKLVMRTVYTGTDRLQALCFNMCPAQSMSHDLWGLITALAATRFTA